MTDRIDTAAERAKLAALEGHTPGPWAVGIDDDGNPLSGRPCVSASEDLDCGIVHWAGFVQEYWRSARGDKEIHANARLIAAAPGLLATVHRLLDALDAEAALQRVVDETWNDAVEAAARVQDIAHQEGANAAGQHYAILALKRPEASHE